MLRRADLERESPISTVFGQQLDPDPADGTACNGRHARTSSQPTTQEWGRRILMCNVK
jgi:hypothetical protein